MQAVNVLEAALKEISLLKEEYDNLLTTWADLKARRDALSAENGRLREVVSLLVEELDDPCRVNFQKEYSAVWLSEPLRQKARAALNPPA